MTECLSEAPEGAIWAGATIMNMNVLEYHRLDDVSQRGAGTTKADQIERNTRHRGPRAGTCNVASLFDT